MSDPKTDERREMLRQLLRPLGGEATLGSLMRAREVNTGEASSRRVVATTVTEEEYAFLERRAKELSLHAELVRPGSLKKSLTPEALLGLLVRYYAEDSGYLEVDDG